MPDRKYAPQITQLPNGNELLAFYFGDGAPTKVSAYFPAEQFVRNAFYVDMAGNILWPIAAPKRTGNDCFVGMIVDPEIVKKCDPEANLDHDMIGIAYFGFRCPVDLNNGFLKCIVLASGVGSR